jgi:G6PDH family F420-dependent oxidoreductase
MTKFGFSLMCELHDPRALVEQAKRAEAAGFDFLTISDHYHPWLYSHDHSPYAWSVLGALAAVTDQIELVSLVTCPTIRYHPAIVAQKAATVQTMSDGRFHLGLGAGENLNEHVVGHGWPPAETRHEMLSEAIDIMRRLWHGDYVTHHGEHYDVEDARVFTLPEKRVPVHVAVSGEKSIALAAEQGDGVIAVQPQSEFVDEFRQQSGQDDVPAFGQVGVAVMDDADEALKIAHDRLRFMIPGWKVMAELPNPINFEAATSTVRPEDVKQNVPCGSDPGPIIDTLKQWTDAGFSHVALMQAPPDQEPFFELWEKELRPALQG